MVANSFVKEMMDPLHSLILFCLPSLWIQAYIFLAWQDESDAFGSFLDSPNTTSVVTYKPKLWFVGGTTPIKVNRSNSGNHGAPSITTLFEIAG